MILIQSTGPCDYVTIGATISRHCPLQGPKTVGAIPHQINMKEIGAGDEIRTHDFNLGKVRVTKFLSVT